MKMQRPVVNYSSQPIKKEEHESGLDVWYLIPPATRTAHDADLKFKAGTIVKPRNSGPDDGTAPNDQTALSANYSH